jgi:hypothetical protein
MMNRAYRLASSLFLAAAIAAPVSMLAAPASQDASVQVRVYDRDHKDYHNWDDNENKRWGLYLQENHLKEHDFKKATRKEQSEYWKWRHDHPDADDRH